MSISKRYDAIIVGARCAGAATALRMASRGMRVLAIDKGDYGSDTLSTHALMRGGVIQLHRWGVLPRIIAAGTPPVRTTTFHYDEDSIAVDIRPSHGTDALYAPRRTVLDAALVDAAAEAGAHIRHRHSLAGLLYTPYGRVRGIELIDPMGKRVEVEAGLVVGADGAGSTVARLVDAPVQRLARHATATFYSYRRGLADAGYHWRYRLGIGTGEIPTNDGQHCVFVGVSPERFRDVLKLGPEAAMTLLLAEASPDLAERVAATTAERRPWAFAGRQGFMRRPFGAGWALVGDAGYFKDPLTAHGITDALRDAELLAEAAAEGTAQAFARYADFRDTLSLPLFEVTDAIASLDWDLERLKELHQELNRVMKAEVEAMTARWAELEPV